MWDLAIDIACSISSTSSSEGGSLLRMRWGTGDDVVGDWRRSTGLCRARPARVNESCVEYSVSGACSLAANSYHLRLTIGMRGWSYGGRGAVSN